MSAVTGFTSHAVVSALRFIYIDTDFRHTTMQMSASTLAALSALDEFSGHRLTCKDDLGLLMELARDVERRHLLDDLSFTAKFLSRSHGIMKRIGPDGEGYERLASEFSLNMEKAVSALRRLLDGSPQEVSAPFVSRYLAMTHDGLQNFLALCYDLSWYKNWLIDRTSPPGGDAP